MKGTGSLDGKPVFDPTRMVARDEVAEMLRRTLASAGIPAEKAQAAITGTAVGPVADTQPIARRESHEWLGRVADQLRGR